MPRRLRVRTKEASGNDSAAVRGRRGTKGQKGTTCPPEEGAGPATAEADTAGNSQRGAASSGSGGSPARRASPSSLGSSPEAEPHRPGERTEEPARTRPHPPPTPGRLTQLATEHSPSTLPIASASRDPASADKMETAPRLLFSGLIYCLAATSGAERTRPSACVASLPLRRGRRDGGLRARS